LIRWRLKLEGYDYEIIHRAGKGNTNTDALSRNPATDDSKTFHIVQKEKEREYSETEKQQILREYHDASLEGHQGVTRTLNRIRLTHNWTGITKDVEEYIEMRILSKNKLSRKMPLILTETSSKPFEKCALDIVGPLNVTTSKYLLTFQDVFTKFSKAIPILKRQQQWLENS